MKRMHKYLELDEVGNKSYLVGFELGKNEFEKSEFVKDTNCYNIFNQVLPSILNKIFFEIMFIHSSFYHQRFIFCLPENTFLSCFDYFMTLNFFPSLSMSLYYSETRL